MAVCLKQISMPIFNGGEFWDIFNLRVVYDSFNSLDENFYTELVHDHSSFI